MMSTLSKAPLIEAWVELRWGSVEKDGIPTNIAFSSEDVDFFPGQFRQAALDCGFTNVERVNPEIVGFAHHIITYRFRKAPAVWPCYQIGVGTFTVNQINEGYGWGNFKPDVIDGLKVLDKGHPLGLSGLSRYGIELRYQDGFPFGEGQTPVQFLESNMQIKFGLPSKFIQFSQLGSQFRGFKMGFNLDTTRPAGQLIIELCEGTINGQPSFIMTTIVRSAEENCPEWTIESISDWLESAHDIQKHAFDTLIDPVFARSFQ